MKKFLSILLTVLICASMFAIASAEEPVTLSIMMMPEWIPGGPVSDHTGETSVVVTKILEEFKKRCPNVELEFEALQGDTDGYNSYLLRGAAGTLPDVTMLDGYWVASFASQGYTYPMEGRIDQKILDDYYDAFKMKYNGETHGLVYSTSFNGVVWYRKSMLKEAGYDELPTDWDEFWKCIRALNKPGEHYGMAMSCAVTEATTCSLLGLYWAGQDVFVDDDNVAQFNNPTSVRIFNTFKELYDEGVMPPETLNVDYGIAQDLFTKGQTATLVHGSWLCNSWDNLAPEFADDIGVALFPKDPDTGKSSENAGGWNFSITTADTSKDEYISVFLDLMLTDPDFASDRILESGDLPVTQTIGALDADWVPEQYRDVIMGVLPDSNTRPVVSVYPTASEYYDEAFQQVLMGEKDAESALADAVKKVANFVEDNDL